MVVVTEGCEVQPGDGEECVEEAGAVLHPLEPGPHQRSSRAWSGYTLRSSAA